MCGERVAPSEGLLTVELVLLLSRRWEFADDFTAERAFITLGTLRRDTAGGRPMLFGASCILAVY